MLVAPPVMLQHFTSHMKTIGCILIICISLKEGTFIKAPHVTHFVFFVNVVGDLVAGKQTSAGFPQL